jgi:hypothetical protein
MRYFFFVLKVLKMLKPTTTFICLSPPIRNFVAFFHISARLILKIYSELEERTRLSFMYTATMSSSISFPLSLHFRGFWLIRGEGMVNGRLSISISLLDPKTFLLSLEFLVTVEKLFSFLEIDFDD